MKLPSPLVSTAWLRDHLAAPRLKILDASWRLDSGASCAYRAYEKKHIPGAVFFDIDAVADTTSSLPHMLPAAKAFGEAAGAMGLSNQDAIIVYDEQGIFSAPRVWWSFRAMGHERVAVLDGGLPNWIAAGGPLASDLQTPAPATYNASLRRSLIADERQVRDAAGDQAGPAIILDARPASRFVGAAPEPREGLRRGAMPHARNIPATELVAADGTLKPVAALQETFARAGFAHNPCITTCGSGVTAAILALALTRIGHHDWRLYDGSWAEWGRAANDENTFPVVTLPSSPIEEL